MDTLTWHGIPTDVPLWKIDHGLHRIEKLRGFWTEFSESIPDLIAFTVDEGAAEVSSISTSRHVRVTAEISEYPNYLYMSSLVSEITHTLRSSLDTLIWGYYSASQHKVSEGAERKITFPIYSHEKYFLANKNSKLKGAPPEVVERIGRVQPYDSRNFLLNQNPLSTLAWVDNQNKHRTLVFAAITTLEHGVGFGSDEELTVAELKQLQEGVVTDFPPLSNKVVLFEGAISMKVRTEDIHPDIELMPVIELEEGPVPLFDVLDTLAGYVRAVVLYVRDGNNDARHDLSQWFEIE